MFSLFTTCECTSLTFPTRDGQRMLREAAVRSGVENRAMASEVAAQEAQLDMLRFALRQATTDHRALVFMNTSKLRSIFLDAGFASLERVQNSTFDNLGFRIMVVKKPA